MIKKIFYTVVFASLLCACSSDNDSNISGESGVVSALELSVPDFVVDNPSETLPLRTSVSGSLKFTWTKGDQVGVWPTLRTGEEETASQVLFTLENGGSTANGIFKGSGWGLLHDRKYYAYFPYDPDARPTLVTRTFATTATQSSNANTAHVGANDVLYATAVTPSDGSSASFQFHHLSSLMRLNISLPTELKSATLKSLVLSSDEEIFPTEITYNPTEDEPTVTVTKKTNRLVLRMGANNAGFKPLINTLYAWFMVAPVDLEGKTINVSLTDGNATYTGHFVGANQIAGHAHQYDLDVSKLDLPEGCVDLGLGVYWATCNLGASAPEHFGDFYAWGETEPYYTAVKFAETANPPTFSSATWKTGYSAGYTYAKYFDTTNGGTTFGKYTTPGQTLALADDAANARLGGKWRMPTTEEVLALYDACDMTASKMREVRGVLCTSSVTGASIFIPANGFFDGLTYDCVNIGFRLWTSTLANKSQAYGWYNSYKELDDSNKQCIRNRNRGHGIRPVWDPNLK